MTELRYGSLKPDAYRPRLVDAIVRHRLDTFGGVEIRGTKWCGKTWTALAAAESVVHVDLPPMLPLIASDPALALQGARPHVIDEWQEVPAIWDFARHAIDNEGGERGMFLLTGSSTPQKDKVHHSGAGRIARVDMETLTLWEQGLSSGSVSLRGLFSGSFSASTEQQHGLGFYAERVCIGGWPALAGANYAVASETVQQYLTALFEVSVPKKGGSPDTARRIAASLARNIATSATTNTIGADAFADNAPTARSTVTRYLELFKELFFLEELPGWDAPIRSKSRLRTKPKRYLADPSLACALLGAGPERLLSDNQLMGLLFESLVVHDLRVYASLLDGAWMEPVRYYQDADGLEVDVIIELSDGRWAGIEIKLGEDKVPEGTRNLQRLRKKIALNPAARNPEPTFMAIITANSPFARYDRENDVYVFPLTALRD